MLQKNVKYTLIKIPKHKRKMTIAIGIKCLDGVLVCSDSQVTYSNQIIANSASCKNIYLKIGDGGKDFCIFTGCGSLDYVDEVYEDIENNCDNEKLVNLKDFRLLVKKSINNYIYSYVKERYNGLVLNIKLEDFITEN